jgi:hypothetical protein
MTIPELIAFWIFVVMTVGFFAWVFWLSRDHVDASPHRPVRKEDGSG